MAYPQSPRVYLVICDQAHVVCYPADVEDHQTHENPFPDVYAMRHSSEQSSKNGLIVTRSTRSSATLTASSQSGAHETEDDAEQGDVQNLKVHLIGINSCPQEEADGSNR